MHCYKFSDRQRRALGVISLSIAALFSVTGCGGGSDGGQSPEEPSASATPSASTNTQSAAEKAVEEAYRKSWDAQVAAYAKASSKNTALKKYTTLEALSSIESDLLSMKEAGQVTTGDPVISPEVTAVDTSKKIPQATIEDCVDISGWKLVEQESKEPVPLPSERLTKYVSVAELEKWGKQWMVTKMTPQDRSC